MKATEFGKVKVFSELTSAMLSMTKHNNDQTSFNKSEQASPTKRSPSKRTQFSSYTVNSGLNANMKNEGFN